MTVTGAEALLRTLADSGVDTCFANPGTSEMHLVAALDAVPGVRPVLALFEGVAAGAADGWARMTGRPAAVLLHLGPGYGNALANLHNARRAHSPLVVVVGDHATYHKRLDAPLESDIDAVAGSVSGWVRRSWRPGDLGPDTADAVAAARRARGRVATLVVPADVSWSDGGRAAPPVPPRPGDPADERTVAEAARALRRPGAVLLVGGRVVADPEAAAAVAAVAAHTGARLLCETFPARQARGAGRPQIGRLAYLGEMAAGQLAGAEALVLLDAPEPVSFFAYPGKPSALTPPGCAVVHLAGPDDDALGALTGLMEATGASGLRPALVDPARPPAPSGRLDADMVAAAVGAALPEDAIVVDEGITSSLGVGRALRGAPPHDQLTLTGGAIGFGLPAATGAAVASPDRPVFALQADGSAMYTVQALWTQAREGLDVTTVIYDNRSYAILAVELDRVQAGRPGPVASSLLDLGRPDLDFCALAHGLGVPAVRVTTGEELTAALARAAAEPGPHLIDALI